MNSTEAFRRARDFLQQHRDDYAAAYQGFRWPDLGSFNWALDWFDILAEGNRRTALHIVEDDGREVKLSYAELAERSNRVAVFLRRRLSPFKRVRRIEFSDLPKTISGKIRRVELRTAEAARSPGARRVEREFWQEDFPELKASSQG